jgi:hypothetical protein
MAMILMNSSSIEMERAVKYRQGLIWKAVIGFWVCILILAFSVSSGFADEEEDAKEKIVLEDMTVIGTPYENPASPRPLSGHELSYLRL